MALVEHCIENMPDRPNDILRVPIPDLAHRVLEIYWQQVRPFEGHELLQRRSGAKSRIMRLPMNFARPPAMATAAPR